MLHNRVDAPATLRPSAQPLPPGGGTPALHIRRDARRHKDGFQAVPPKKGAQSRESYCVAAVFLVIKELMQISRSIRLACVTATVVLPLALSAQDNDAQTKLRQALEQKMSEMQGTPVAPTPPPVSAATNLPSKPKPPVAATKKPAPAVTVAPKPAPIAPAIATAPTVTAAPVQAASDAKTAALEMNCARNWRRRCRNPP